MLERKAYALERPTSDGVLQVSPIPVGLSLLSPADLEGARELLESYEAAGWISTDEAAEWAVRIDARRQVPRARRRSIAANIGG